MKYLKLFEDYNKNEYYQEISKSDWNDIFKDKSLTTLAISKSEISEISELFPKNELRIGEGRYLDSQKIEEDKKIIFTNTLKEEYSKGTLIIYNSEEKMVETHHRRNIYYKIPASIRPSNDTLFLKKQYHTEVRRHDLMMIIKTEDDYYYVYTVGIFEGDKLEFDSYGLKTGYYNINRYFKCDQIDGVIELIKDLKNK